MKLPSLSAIGILALPFLYSSSVQAESLRGGSSSTESHRHENRRRLIDLTNKYIVVYKAQSASAGTDATLDPSIAEIKAQVESSVASLGGEVTHSYSHALNAFAATLPQTAYNTLIANPNIAYIEPDGIATISTTQTADLSWGLDRIDQKTGTDGKYTYSATGAGVHAYTIDTGISSTHVEFTGRFGEGYNAVTGDVSSPQPWDDCNEHGTHVSSTIGGTKYGVAKQVTFHAVRVLDCFGSGTFEDVIAGMDWVAAHHTQNPGQKSVANMSLGGSKLLSLNQAANNLVAAGVVLAAAAGNSDGDACTFSPASADNVIAVAATDVDDSRAYFSNYGPCVEVFAPGVDILGANFQCPDDSCTLTISGTSMATPHVTGVAALYLEKKGGTPADVMTAILNNAVNGIVTNPWTNPNKFLQSNTAAEGNAKKCRAAGKSCRKRFCRLTSACCCSGLSCQSDKRGNAGMCG